MEARHGNIMTESSSEGAVCTGVTEGLVDNLKAICQRAGERAVERGKAADRAIRDHPYQTIGVAFGLGLLVGFVVWRN